MTNTPHQTIKNECYSCLHRVAVPGNTHITCAAPDLNMTGDVYAIKRGWFHYPILFDPVWKTAACANFQHLNTKAHLSETENAK